MGENHTCADSFVAEGLTPLKPSLMILREHGGASWSICRSPRVPFPGFWLNHPPSEPPTHPPTSGFVYKELTPKKGVGVWVGPTKGPLIQI